MEIKMYNDLLKRLEQDGSTGLDMSPGNDLSLEAAKAIRELIDIIEENNKQNQIIERTDILSMINQRRFSNK